MGVNRTFKFRGGLGLAVHYLLKDTTGELWIARRLA